MINSKRVLVYCFMQLLIFAGLSLWLYQQNQPIDLAAPTQDKLQCVSYAPYYQKGQSPLIEGMMVSHAQIDHDLKALAKVTNCVRTYSVAQGLDYVPAAAQKLGLTVYLGAWIGWTDLDNKKEVDLATKVANNYPKTVKALIIGNEVLLRQEQTESALIGYLQRAKSQTNIPITYAEVWEFWLRHPKLAPSVDFITVHILPYWEDNPVEVAQGAQHTSNVMQQLASHFDQPILIGETGWPSAGRQRDTAKPSLVNQARYIREFLIAAEQNQWRYNIIEAIDQPWKRALEGTVGAYWGLYSPDLAQKFSLQDTVAERQDGWLPLLLATAGGLLFFALSRTQAQPGVTLAHTLLGASTGLAASLQFSYLTASCETWLESLPFVALILVGWFGLVHLVTQHAAKKHNHNSLKWVLAILLIASVVTSYLLYHDGRYRDFPIALLIIPSLAFFLARWLSPINTVLGNWRFAPVMVGIVYAALVVIAEPDNQTAIAWAMTAGLLAFANWPTSAKDVTTN